MLSQTGRHSSFVIFFIFLILLINAGGVFAQLSFAPPSNLLLPPSIDGKTPVFGSNRIHVADFDADGDFDIVTIPGGGP